MTNRERGEERERERERESRSGIGSMSEVIEAKHFRKALRRAYK